MRSGPDFPTGCHASYHHVMMVWTSASRPRDFSHVIVHTRPPIRSTTPLTAGPGSVKLTINPDTLSLRVQIPCTTILILISHTNNLKGRQILFHDPHFCISLRSRSRSVCSPRLRHRPPSSTSSRLPFALKGPRAVSLESSADTSTRRTTLCLHKHGLERSFHTSDAGASAAMSLQDRKDAGCWKLLGGQRVCAHRHGEILCCQGHQQEAYGRTRAHGQERNRCSETRVYGT
jgi:hypothetical protein